MGNDPLLQVARLLDDNMQVDFDCELEQSFFPVVDLKKLENEAVEPGEGDLMLVRHCPKQRYQN